MLAERSKVVVMDTTNDIGGDGDIPHQSLGLARRMMIPSLKEQAKEITQCAENYAPEVLVVDKVGCEQDIEALKLCRDRGIRLMASAQATLLNPLVATNGTMPFDIVVELQNPHQWNVIDDLPGILKCVERGEHFRAQCRIRNPVSGAIQVRSELIGPPVARVCDQVLSS